MTAIEEKLDKLVEAGDQEGFRRFVRERSSEEHSQLSKRAKKWFKKASHGSVGPRPNKPGSYGWNWDMGDDSLAVATGAVLTFCSGEELSSLDFPVSVRDFIDWDLLVELKPPGLDAIGDVLLESSTNFFPVVRKMMKLGLCRKPVGDAYLVALIGSPYMAHNPDGKWRLLRDTFLENPDMIEDIYRLFEVEGDQENSLASVDKYSAPENNWQNTLLYLCKEGHLNRERLLDESLAALLRDFIQFRAGWFSRFHEALEPTYNERKEREETYLKLLGSSIPPTVSFALKALKQIQAKLPIKGEYLDRYLAPALAARSKSSAMAALALVEKTIKKDVGYRSPGLILAAESLCHETPEVAEKVVSLLKAYGNPDDAELSQAVASRLELAPVSVQASIEGWLQSSSAPTPVRKVETGASKSIHYEFDPHASDGYPLAFVSPVEPIESIDELIEKAAYCLENIEDVAEFERVLDAMARLPVVRDAEFKKNTGALKKRALQFRDANHFSTPFFKRVMAGGFYGWLTQPVNPSPYPPDSFEFEFWDAASDLFRGRFEAILKRVAEDVHAPVLSTPTHSQGWIDADVLRRRVALYRELDLLPDDNDLILAIFRTASLDDFSEVLGDWSKKSDRVKAAIAYLKLSPRENLKLANGYLITEKDSYPAARWLYFSIPRLREVCYRVNKGYAAECIDWMEVAHYRLAASLEVLMESGAPLGEFAYKLMGTGLIVAEARCCSLAREAMIIAIEDKRLSVIDLAETVRAFLHSERTKPRRLAESLKEVARVSDLHADAVRQVIEATLVGDGKQAPRGLSYLLEFYLELLIQCGATLTSEETRSYLASVEVSGKTAKLIKRLLL
ncbi:MAG: hypothetical protein H6677_24165 [Candidatus Obscuribacterales bacterium]|nr:hypothetical protein [Candidatus Obscuribacterales bacterium]